MMKLSVTRRLFTSLSCLLFLIIIGAPLSLFESCATDSSQRKWKIGISQCSDDDWRAKMNREVEHELLIHPEAEVEIRSADDDSRKQCADIQYFIDNGFDMIIAAPNEADAVTPSIRKAHDAGIPVMLFDRSINDSCYTAWRGADNVAIGNAAGEYAVALAAHNGGKAKILELFGLRGSTPAEGRHRGFIQAISDHPELTLLSSVEARWNEGPATRITDSILRLHPDLDIIYAHNDRMAIAASKAARKLGLRPKVIGIDAAPEIGVKAVRDRIIDATFLYPTEGNKIIRTALDILEGRPYDRYVAWPSAWTVDSSNADILLQQNESLEEEIEKMRTLKGEMDQFWQKHSAQTSLFYLLIAFLVLLCLFLFLLLRAFWTNKRHQAELEARAELLRIEKEKQVELNGRLSDEKEKQVELNARLRDEKEKQEFLNEEIRRATQSKLAFFTNVSHDLRTPLTLIQEPIEQLIVADNLTSSQKILMRIASRNVGILHRLIDQILDFQKYENGLIHLHRSHADLTALVREWISAFEILARKRDIRLYLNMPETPLYADIDIEKIERVFFNLMSNAFKHTPANGIITFSLAESEPASLIFSVADTGEGMAAEELPNIFDRFYQVDQVRPKGSGIGLAIVKAFIDLHGGSISVESEPGRGSTFTVVLPLESTGEAVAVNEASSISKSQIVHSTLTSAVEAEIRDIEASIDEKVAAFDTAKPLILLIEDNSDMRRMIATLLADDYNIIYACDGREGLAFAARYVPDLVISDVMMPGMDGIECCRRIKEEISTSHIPVLLLTACSLDEQKAQGYDSGADRYLSKPFNIEVLRSRIRSLIANRRRIRDVWNNANIITLRHGEEKPLPPKASVTPSETGRPKLSPLDNDFYNRFIKKVEESLGDPDLNVDGLAAELGLGRSQFYRKIKALTNYSPVELLRRMRLQRARDLLTTTGHTISEIAYAVGFSTPAYFTKCFREAYGVTPTELRDNLYAS